MRRIDPAGTVLCHDPAMGRHGVAEDPAPVAEPTRGRWIVVLIALLVVVLGLGLWWWSQRAPRDPIDAAPVAATAVVLTSPACAADGTGDTVVDLGLDTSTRSSLSGCGFAAGQRLDVEYRSGDPARVRLAGTSTAGSGGAPRWLPFLILLVGLLVLGITATLLFFGAGRRRTTRVEQAARISVAELRRTRQSPVPPAGSENHSTSTVPVPADPVTPQGPESARHAG